MNFLYFELIEMFISLLIWKGIWDLFEVGILDMLESEKIDYGLTIYMTLIIGYFLFLLTIVVEKVIIYVLIRRREMLTQADIRKLNVRSHLLNIYYLVCLLVAIAIWRTFFSGYDYFVGKSEKRNLIYVLSHAIIFLAMYASGLSSALNGPASCDPRDYGIEGVDAEGIVESLLENKEKETCSDRLFVIDCFS